MSFVIPFQRKSQKGIGRLQNEIVLQLFVMVRPGKQDHLVKPITCATGSIVDLEQKKTTTEEGQQTHHQTQRYYIFKISKFQKTKLNLVEVVSSNLKAGCIACNLKGQFYHRAFGYLQLLLLCFFFAKLYNKG